MRGYTNPYQTDQDPADIEYDVGAMAAPNDRQFATTLAAGLQILRCFTPVRPVLGNSELARRTDLSRPTISRFTYTLVKLGYLRGDPATGKYRLGPASISLAYPLLASITMRQVARPLMNELAKALHASVSMGIRDRLSIVYVETSRSDSNWSAQLSDIGLRYPIASTAIGHAFVAGCEPALRESILNEIKVRTPSVWAKHGARLLQAQDEFSRKGFCSSYGEQHPDYFAVGVPMGRSVEGELLVFNSVAPLSLASRNVIENTFGPRLVALVEQLRELARVASR
ncbi:IclR family transcriptional regulator [Comamonadaceae bacterium G21597-S1]|nr:IclR family transcriptional regulator [Comamonadaceae bacterium G21597-S1]